MKEEAAPIAAEMSGHMYFSENWYGFDDGIYAACRLAELVSRSRKPFSAMLDDAPSYVNSPEIRVACPDDKKFGVVERLQEYFKARYPVNDLDGARVLFDDGWALVRASNTEPKLVLRFEGKDQATVDRLEREMRERIAEFDGAG
jgi:phosphomannomutase/phosphoglucomutase